jgi:hypothetical protein
VNSICWSSNTTSASATVVEKEECPTIFSLYKGTWVNEYINSINESVEGKSRQDKQTKIVVAT